MRVASIGYRPSTAATFPAQLDDCLLAIAAFHDEAEIWGIDRERICVAGTAAGGHLAALAGLWDEPASGRQAARRRRHLRDRCPDTPHHARPGGERARSPASQFVGGPLPEFREGGAAGQPADARFCGRSAGARRAWSLAHGRAHRAESEILHGPAGGGCRSSRLVRTGRAPTHRDSAASPAGQAMLVSRRHARPRRIGRSGARPMTGRLSRRGWMRAAGLAAGIVPVAGLWTASTSRRDGCSRLRSPSAPAPRHDINH